LITVVQCIYGLFSSIAFKKIDHKTEGIIKVRVKNPVIVPPVRAIMARNSLINSI